MKITRTSIVSGITRTLDIPVTQEQLDRWESGVLIQNAMPHLNLDDREFIMTGITSQEWEELFAEKPVEGPNNWSETYGEHQD